MKELGILCHITSLKSKYGIGDFGKSSIDFIKYIKSKGFSIWQILPLNDTNDFNCPYGTRSALTLDEQFIDLDQLVKLNLIQKTDLISLINHTSEKVDYEFIKKEKRRIVEIAYSNIDENMKVKLNKFIKKYPHIKEYSYYKTLLEINSTHDWRTIENINREDIESKYSTIIYKYIFIQYLLYTQWSKVKKYANKNNIKIIGDMPIYCEPTSFDVYYNRDIFLLDENNNPIATGGAPADLFCTNEQNWGTCIYNWKLLEKQKYKWFTNRIKILNTFYDYIRIDHFPGLVEFYQIDAHDPTKNCFQKGGSYKLFDTIQKTFSLNRFIIEDIGFMPDSCNEVKEHYNLTGMRVIEFGFNTDNNNPHYPTSVPSNCIYYSSNHDCNTLIGWLNNASKTEKNNLKEYFKLDKYNKKQAHINCCKALVNSNATTIIFQIQDLLKEDENKRMNIPGQAQNCWEYKVPNNYKTSINRTLKEIL